MRVSDWKNLKKELDFQHGYWILDTQHGPTAGQIAAEARARLMPITRISVRSKNSRVSSRRKKNALAFTIKRGRVMATHFPARIQIEIKPRRWIDWNRKTFLTVRAAKAAALKLLRKFPKLRRYGVRIAGGALRAGRIKNSRHSSADAKKLYRAFRESAPGRVRRGALNIPKAAAVVGRTEFIGYTTTHGRKSQAYRHDFAPGSRPLLVAGSKPGQVFMVGKRHQFTARGIVDLDAQGKAIDD